jgi:hypothetical protein
MAIRSTSYISEHRKRREKVRRYVFLTLAVFVLYFLFLGGTWLIVRSPLFRLQHITVTGNNIVASQDIITLLQANPSGRHNFFDSVLGWSNMLVWPHDLSLNQTDLIPQLASVSINKDYFSRSITVTVTERAPFGVWCFLPKGASAAAVSTASVGANTSISAISTSSMSASIGASTSTASVGVAENTDGGRCYWFDNAGVLFEKATNTEGNLIVVVYDRSQAIRGLNQKVLPDDFVSNFISVVNVLRKSNIGIQEIDLNDISLEEVDAITTAGPKIYFSLRFPADDYSGVLQSLVAQGGFNKLQYVDCRTEDRVYYK